MRVERVPIANADLDAAERQIRAALAEIEAAYRRDAEPWLKRLAEIEDMRQYRVALLPDLDEPAPQQPQHSD